MAPVLGYWKIRGLASPIRYLLEYKGVDYKEEYYECGPPPNFDRSQWLDKKFTMGLDFPNLPYYIDGDVKLSQSGVILRHLARKHGLAGNNETDQLRADLMASQCADYHMEYGRIVYSPDFNNLKGEYTKNMPTKLELLTKMLGSNKFVVGDYVTYADFVLFEYLENQLFLNPDVLKGFDKLVAFHERVRNLPSMKSYLDSPRAIKYPFNGAPALWGGPFSDQLQKN